MILVVYAFGAVAALTSPGCIKLACPDTALTAFGVTLHAASGTLPGDLQVRFTCGSNVRQDSLLGLLTDSSVRTAEIYCHTQPPMAGPDAGPTAFTSLTCGWCSEPPEGTLGVFEATAAGFQPVVIVLISEGNNASECNTIPQGVEATLEPT